MARLAGNQLAVYALLAGFVPLAAADSALDDRIKIAHAVLGSVAFIIFFPLGAVIMRVLSGPSTWLVHAGIQLFSLALFTATFGMGIKLAKDTQQLREYHPIVGYVLFSLMWSQVIWGYLSHKWNQKHTRRTFLAYGHVWLGRTLITLGMIQGGLGLLLSDDGSKADYEAYGIVAGIVWVAYMAFSVWSDVKRPPRATEPKSRRTLPRDQEEMAGQESDAASKKSEL